MCGIAGVISWSGRHRVTREMLASMSACIAHRGPDGEGLHLSHEGDASRERPQIGLVHRRLAILDPDLRSNQPFTDGRGRWIVFNGEIYNFRALRRELESLLPDWPWRTTGDTEVLLASSVAWGEKCVDHLSGMFAFAIIDENRQTMLLARDRMGQKPLYVAYARPTTDELDPDQAAHTGDPLYAIAFSSDVAGFRSLPWVKHEVNADALTDYLRWGYISPPYTIYDGVHECYPGSAVAFERNTHKTSFYFSAARPWREIPQPFDDIAAVKLTREHVSRSVREQLVSDVPIGCFLSGGVDSSIIALEMTRSTSRPQDVRTFSIGFDDPRYDESAYAAEVAKHLSTTHESMVIRPNVAESLLTLARNFGQPFGDSSALPTYWLSKMTRQHVKVALSGDGGDELFGGYDRYRAVRLIDRVSLPGSIASKVANLLGGGHPKSRRARFARLAEAMGHPPHEAYSRMLRLMPEETIRGLLKDTTTPLKEILEDSVANSVKLAAAKSDIVHAAMASDRGHYLPGDLLTKVDRASMAHALEVRSPFMDHELVRFAAGLTPLQLLKGGGKRMLREAYAADLPASVFGRKKMGFAVPVGEWLRGELRAMLHDHLFATDSFARTNFHLPTVQRMMDEHEQSRVDHSQRLYALLMLELWWRTTR